MNTANNLDQASAHKTAGVSPATPRLTTKQGGKGKFHIVAINQRTGAKTYMTAYPATHREACTMLSKISTHPARRVQLETA